MFRHFLDQRLDARRITNPNLINRFDHLHTPRSNAKDSFFDANAIKAGRFAVLINPVPWHAQHWQPMHLALQQPSQPSVCAKTFAVVVAIRNAVYPPGPTETMICPLPSGQV